ncbi:MAG TPA: hypothetical protein VES88_12510 [Gemmatimonadaceae bacterium]|nr:hypothetical protein [Gemmatimonadaceae bacterium]
MGHSQQPLCDRAKTANECLSKLRAQSGSDASRVAAAAQREGEEIKRGVDAKPTGTAAAVAGSGVAIKDFLPRLATALAIPGLTADTKALGLRFNVKPNDPVWKLPFALQLESIANEAVVYEPLIANVPEKSRATVRDSLKKSLGDFDDVQFSGALNWESLRFGRSFRTHQGEINALTTELFTPLDIATAQSANSLILTLPRQPVRTTPQCDTQTHAATNIPLNCFSQADQQTFETKIISLAQLDILFEQNAAKLSKLFGLDRLEDLLNNQPQLNITGFTRRRSRTVGPNGLKASLKYEYSPVNLNKARAYCAQQDPGRSPTLHPQCYNDYLSQPGVLTSLDRGTRIWFVVDVLRIDAYKFAFPPDSAPVSKPRNLVMEPAAGFGSFLPVPDQTARIDAEIRYRYSDDETVREKRWVGTVTLTQKINDQSDGILTLKWANKAEFLGDVDHKVRLNLGYSYKVSDRQ